MDDAVKEIINKSVVGKDFLNAEEKGLKHPNIDKFLDYRLAISFKQDLNISTKEMDNQWFIDELKAVDEVMKILTITTFIFLPLSLLAALFGMNAKYMPVVGQTNDFWILTLAMAIIAAFLFLFFKIKKWL